MRLRLLHIFGDGLAAELRQHTLQDQQVALTACVHYAGLFQYRVHVRGLGQRIVAFFDGGGQHGLYVSTLGGGVHGPLGGETGDGQHCALGGLHNGLISGGYTFLHGGGEGGGVSGLHALQSFGKAPEQQGEDDAGVAPGTLKQSGGGDGGRLSHRGGSGLAQRLGSGGDGHGHIGARVTVRHGEYIKIVDGLLLGRDSGGPVQDHLLEKRTGDFFTHSSAVLLTGSWNLRTHPQRGPPHRCSYSPRSVPRS